MIGGAVIKAKLPYILLSFLLYSYIFFCVLPFRTHPLL